MLRRLLATFFTFCLLWSGLFYGFHWGFSVHAAMTLMWVSASLACLVAVALRNRDGPASAESGLTILALVCGVAASQSSASGMGVWAGLLVIAISSKLSLRIAIAILAVGCVMGALLAIAPSYYGTSADVVVLSFRAPGRLLASSLSFLGGPVAWTVAGWIDSNESLRYRISLWAGALGLLLALACGVRALRRPKALDAPALLGLAMMADGVAVSVLVGLGRSIRSTDFVGYRFIPFSMAFWMGAVSTLVSDAYGGRHPRVRVLLALLLPVLSIAMLPALEVQFDRQRRLEGRVSKYSLMVLVGIRGEEVRNALAWVNEEAFYGFLPTLERDGRGPFAHPGRDLLGRPLHEFYELAGEPRCSGAMIRVWQEVDAGGGESGAAISGVAALTQGGSALRSILVVDRRGVIRGIGAPSHEGKSAKTRWYAFLGPHQTDRRFFLHAALEDGSVCRLGTGRTAQRSKV